MTEKEETKNNLSNELEEEIVSEEHSEYSEITIHNNAEPSATATVKWPVKFQINNRPAPFTYQDGSFVLWLNKDKYAHGKSKGSY